MSDLKSFLEEVTNTVGQVDVHEEELNNHESRIKRLETEISQIETVDSSNQLISLASSVGTLSGKVSALEVLLKAASLNPTWLPPYHFELNPKDPDQSWNRIIKKGQELQKEFYFKGEEYWQSKQGDSPSGYGWYGTVSMPVITIVCTAPEYNFYETKRLPGRFRLWSPARWGSTLRFHCNTETIIRDEWTNNRGVPYGFNTHAAIGLYVEPSTVVEDRFVVRPFEQTIDGCVIVAHNGTLPIYLADNQDRFLVRDCNIMNHQGASVGIKHGPPIKTDMVEQDSMDNVYLADPRFLDLQMEGPHTMQRPQAAVFATGNNVRISGLNLYGWLQGVYLHGGKNRYVQAQVHKSNTHDGRVPLKLDEVVGITLNKYSDDDRMECAGAATVGFPSSANKAYKTLGTHEKGDPIYGG